MNNGLKFPMKVKNMQQRIITLKEEFGKVTCYLGESKAWPGPTTIDWVRYWIDNGYWTVIEEEKAKHPHDEIIRAWLDGKTVQFKYGGEWISLSAVMAGKSLYAFHVSTEHRIKPEDPDVYVSFVAYDAPVGVNHVGSVERVKMKLSEFNKISNTKK